MKHPNRRDFGKSAVIAGLATAASYNRVLGANERVRLGFIGLGNRGDQMLDAFLAHKDQEVAALCDIWQPYLDFAASKAHKSAKQFHDYRKLLEMKEIDAVVVASPDHWHCLQTVEACQAGKDVYVEKPLSLYVAEGRKMIEAARKHERVTQVGLMRRSDPFVKEACELVLKGGIGKVVMARAFAIHNEFPNGIGSPPNETPPEGLDWEAWVGPAPMKPYNKNRTLYRYRWFYDYSGGQITNLGTHYMDVIHRALGQEHPLAATAMGGKFAVTDNREIPDTLEVLWTYPGNTLVSFLQLNANGAPANVKQADLVLGGTKGTLYMTTAGFEVVPELIHPDEMPPRSPLSRPKDRLYRSNGKPELEAVKKTGGHEASVEHARNFLDCVKSRKRCNCDIETGHFSTVAATIGGIAHRTKSYLEWDARAERFTNNDAANKLLTCEYRAPYKMPT